MTEDRGKTWFKWYRKTENSDIWDRPPIYLKTWAWLLANVDLDTGEITCTYEHIADRIQWSDKGHPHIPSRRLIHDILHWMKLNSMLRITTLGEGNRKYTKISICQWSTYQAKKSTDGNKNETEKSLSLKKEDIEEKQILSPLEKNLGEDGVSVKTETSLSKLSAKIHADPNFEFAKAVALYFHDTNPCATKPDKTSRKDRLEAIGAICDALRIDLKNEDGSRERIWKVIHYAANDVAIPGARFDGWQKNMQSLKSLRKRNDEGKLKHENIWNRMPDHKKNAHLPMIEYDATPPMPTLEGEHHG